MPVAPLTSPSGSPIPVGPPFVQQQDVVVLEHHLRAHVPVVVLVAGQFGVAGVGCCRVGDERLGVLDREAQAQSLGVAAARNGPLTGCQVAGQVVRGAGHLSMPLGVLTPGQSGESTKDCPVVVAGLDRLVAVRLQWTGSVRQGSDPLCRATAVVDARYSAADRTAEQTEAAWTRCLVAAPPTCSRSSRSSSGGRPAGPGCGRLS